MTDFRLALTDREHITRAVGAVRRNVKTALADIKSAEAIDKLFADLQEEFGRLRSWRPKPSRDGLVRSNAMCEFEPSDYSLLRKKAMARTPVTDEERVRWAVLLVRQNVRTALVDIESVEAKDRLFAALQRRLDRLRAPS